MTDTIRPERAEDWQAIRAVNVAAFATPDEARLVEQLRRDGDLVLSLVAERGGAIIGHVAFSRVRVEDSTRSHDGVALAPVAVTPSRQRQSVGTSLITRGLALLAEQDESMVFVLGDPAYYRRFGFDADAATSFSSDYAGPCFQLRRLSRSGVASGRVRYPAAFTASS